MTLGQILKNKRNELHKSIEQISTATRIHVKVLKALEDDQYADLPARAFTRGFIITYCKALQLNPDEILASYHDFLESKFAERPEKDQGHHGYAFEGSENEQKNRGMIIIASIAAFFAIMTLLFFKPQNHKHREKHKELIAEEAESAAAEAELKAATDAIQAAAANSTPASLIVATPTSTPDTTTTNAPTLVATTSPTPAAASETATASPTPKEDPMNKGDALAQDTVGVKINFQAMEDVILRYRSDLLPVMGLTLRKDKQLVIKAKDFIRFETSHPELLKWKTSFKNKPGAGYQELKESSLEVKADGNKAPAKAGLN